MRTKITIDNFRGVKTGVVEDLAQLSVFVGPNNSGKSTVLEALYLLGGGHPLDVVDHVVKRRGWAGVNCVPKLAFDPTEPVVLKSSQNETNVTQALTIERLQDDNIILVRVSGARSARLRFDIRGNVQQVDGDQAMKPARCQFIDLGVLSGVPVIEDAYSAAVGDGIKRESEIDKLLEEIDSEKPTLRILKSGGEFVLHKLGANSVPVYFTGDGFKRLLFVACILAHRTQDLVLLEEPECFQHPTYLKKLAGLFWGAVKQGTQIIMSSHSIELLEYIFGAEGAPLEKAAVFHTRLQAGQLKVNRIPGDLAADRLARLGEDLRK